MRTKSQSRKRSLDAAIKAFGEEEEVGLSAGKARMPEGRAPINPMWDAAIPPEEWTKNVSASDTSDATAAADAERFARSPSMGAFGRVVESFFAIDVEGEYGELEDKLTLGRASEAEHAVLVGELDLAGDRARRAHLLYVNARVALEGFEIDATVIESDMRAQATAVLQAEKAAGHRSKAITDADVESQIGKMFPDQYRANRIGREKAKRAVEHLKAFAELWSARQQALDAIVRTARR